MNEPVKQPNIKVGHTTVDDKPDKVLLYLDGTEILLDAQGAEYLAEQLARQAEIVSQPRIVLSS